MKLLPYGSFVIETPLPLDDVLVRLRAHVGPKSFLPKMRARHEFDGTVGHDSFMLRPSVHAYTAFLPEFHGRLNEKDESVVVIVECTPNLAVLMILTILSGLLCMLIFSGGLRVYVVAAASSVLTWFISICGFWLDGGRFQRKLEKMFHQTSQTDSEQCRLDAGVSK
jgi:hypothetical protein